MAQSAKRLTATGDVSTGPTKLLAVSGVFTAAGLITLKDGGSSGVTKAVFDTPGAAFFISIPHGLAFPSGLHATMTGTPTGVTFWLGG